MLSPYTALKQQRNKARGPKSPSAADPPPVGGTVNSMPEQPQEPEKKPSSAASDPVPDPVPEPDTGYTPAGVPTLEGVREKIETRYGTALGATELAEETPEARSAAEKFDKRQKAAEEKLEEIRASMREQD